MPIRISILAVLSILTLFASACGAPAPRAFVVSSTPVSGYDGHPTEAIPPTGATGTAMPSVTQPSTSATPAATASPATEGAPTSDAASGTQDASGTSLVTVTLNLTYGSILADGNGRALYLFTRDTPNTPTCYGGCATTWPPFLTDSGTASAGTGLDATLVGTARRTDGATQVTYNGWPLYYYSKDPQNGIANGQAIGGTWYLVTPNGDPLK
jgi:predicted lipoprotein with Yx(FWY)xxD motif